MSETLDLKPWASADYPAHLRDDLTKTWLLRRWGNFMRGLFGVPIYLVGSALRDENHDPRDWDVRCTIDDEWFRVRYGSIDRWKEQRERGDFGREMWRWSDEMIKYSKHGAKHTHENIDFQIFPTYLWTTLADKPRVQLDTRIPNYGEAASVPAEPHRDHVQRPDLV